MCYQPIDNKRCPNPPMAWMHAGDYDIGGSGGGGRYISWRLLVGMEECRAGSGEGERDT